MGNISTETLRVMLLATSMIYTFWACAQNTETATTDLSNKRNAFSGSICFETNYGNKHGESKSDVWDFPHTVAEGEVCIGKNWHIAAEFEYERFKEDGVWANSFKDNFTTNKLYIAKQLCKGATIKTGILEIPIGFTNRGGQPLTIYDPASEAAIIPMTWHEFGVGMSWGKGSWAYNIILPFYFDAPIKRSRPIGAATRIENTGITDGLTIGASGFWGTTSVGMLAYSRPEPVEYSGGTAIASVDAEWAGHGFIANGSAIYCTGNNAGSAGIEAGYDIVTSCLPSLNGKACIMPFARYDVVSLESTMSKITFGLNVSPVKNLTLKAEWSSEHCSGEGASHRTDLGISYMLEF